MPVTSSWIDWLASQSEVKRTKILGELSDDEITLLMSDWRFTARPEQLAPNTADRSSSRPIPRGALGCSWLVEVSARLDAALSL
jgi:hypothetical protein